MIDLLEHIVVHYGYWAVGVIICLEAMGLPLPGESLMIGTAIYTASTGALRIEWVVIAAAVGAIMGDNFGYLIGAWLGRPALERWGPKIGLSVERQRLGQYLFRRFGGVVVFFGRFIAFLRTFAALLAGTNRMPWGRFLWWNALGGIAWTHLYGISAYLLGTQVHKLVGPVGIVLGVVGAIAAVWVFRFLKRHERRMIALATAEMEREAKGVPAH